MQRAAEALAVRSPAQIGGRVERALGGRIELAAHDVGEPDLVIRPRRLAVAAPDLFVRVGEERRDDVLEAGTAIGAILG